MWITVREYAEREGIQAQSVGRRVKSGRVKMKKEDGRVYIEVPDEEGQEQTMTPTQALNASLATRYDVENELKKAKVRNLEAEIVLKKQKSVVYRERLRTEFCEGILEAYTDAFSDLKGIVVDLKLKKEHIRRFKDCYSKCLKKFEAKLKAYLKTKDKEEEEESRNDTSCVTTKEGME